MRYGNLCCLQFLPFSFNALRKVEIQVVLDFIPSITPQVLVPSLLFSQKLQLHTIGCVYPLLPFYHIITFLFPQIARVPGSTISSCVCHYTVRKIMTARCIGGQNMFKGDPRGYYCQTLVCWQPGLQGGYCLTQHKLLHYSPCRHSRVLLYWQAESLAALCPFVQRNKS